MMKVVEPEIPVIKTKRNFIEEKAKERVEKALRNM